MRFALAQSLGLLLRIFPASLFSRLTRKTLLLDAEARDDGLFAVAPVGCEVVVASATPLREGAEPYGPTFDPAHPPFPAKSFHAVLAGPSLLSRTGAEREMAFKGLLGLARGVLVLSLPASGSLGELGAEAAVELARRRLGPTHPYVRVLEAECTREGPTPGELEELAGLERAALLYLPAGDPVGTATLVMLRAFVLGLPEGERLANLVDRFHNTALVEAGPTLGSRYQDLALIFPGRRNAPAGVAARLAEERAAGQSSRRTDLGQLQLALELDARDRARAPATTDAGRPVEAPMPADLARWREVFDEMARKVERMAREAEAATGRALQGTDQIQRRLEAAMEAVAAAQSGSAVQRERELDAERERRVRSGREAAEAKQLAEGLSGQVEELGRSLERERALGREQSEAALAYAARAEADRRGRESLLARTEAARVEAEVRSREAEAQAAATSAELARARERGNALEAELAALVGRNAAGAGRTIELEAQLAELAGKLRSAERAAREAETRRLAREAEFEPVQARMALLETEGMARGAELAAAREALAMALAEGRAAVEAAEESARSQAAALAARAGLEARVVALQASYDGLAAEIEEFRRVVSVNPLLKAYIVAKGARLPGGSPGAVPSRGGQA